MRYWAKICNHVSILNVNSLTLYHSTIAHMLQTPFMSVSYQNLIMNDITQSIGTDKSPSNRLNSVNSGDDRKVQEKSINKR